MNRFLRGAALLLAITGTAWLATLWRWEVTRRDVTVSDIVVYLAVLPLIVFGVSLGLRRNWQVAGVRRAAALAASTAAPAAVIDSIDESVTPQDAGRRHATLQVLSAHVACSAGATPADVLAALVDQRLRPKLDPELRDADGLAVMCSRVEELPLDALSRDLVPVLAGLKARCADPAALQPEEHVSRALALLAEPLASALSGLYSWAAQLGVPERQSIHLPARQRADAAAARVRLLLGWPEEWTEFERDVATEWARRLVTSHTDVPIERFQFEGHACASGEALLLHADQLLQTLGREAGSDLVIVAACHSDLSEAAVLRLEQEQRLFSSLRHPKGLMPGEAAAVLVLAHADWPSDPQLDPPAARLHRPAWMTRDKSVEAAGRVSSQCVQDCIAQALSAARIEPADLPALVCDADQHTPRGAELYGATLTLLPHLDPTDDMRLIGIATGHTGIASPLLTIAIASEQARSQAAHCLALCVGDACARLAVVLRPGEVPLHASDSTASA